MLYGERFALEEAEGQRYDSRRRPSAAGEGPLTGFAAIQVCGEGSKEDVCMAAPIKYLWRDHLWGRMYMVFLLFSPAGGVG